MEIINCQNVTRCLVEWKDTAQTTISQLKKYAKHQHVLGNLENKLDIEKNLNKVEEQLEDIEYLLEWLNFYSFNTYRHGKSRGLS